MVFFSLFFSFALLVVAECFCITQKEDRLKNAETVFTDLNDKLVSSFDIYDDHLPSMLFSPCMQIINKQTDFYLKSSVAFQTLGTHTSIILL